MLISQFYCVTTTNHAPTCPPPKYLGYMWKWLRNFVLPYLHVYPLRSEIMMPRSQLPSLLVLWHKRHNWAVPRRQVNGVVQEDGDWRGPLFVSVSRVTSAWLNHEWAREQMHARSVTRAGVGHYLQTAGLTHKHGNDVIHAKHATIIV